LEVLVLSGDRKELRDRHLLWCWISFGGIREKAARCGIQNVKNMSGSIFEWADEGHKVEPNGERVDKVASLHHEMGQAFETLASRKRGDCWS